MASTDWARDCEDPLAGLLSVEVDTQVDASPPWVVIHLHSIKAGGAAPLRAALVALARLHLLSSASAASASAQAALWTRVLTSRMMALPLRELDADVKRFVRFLYQSANRSATSGGIRVLLNWTGAKVDALVCPLLAELLKMTRPSDAPPLTIGLALTRCRLTSHTIGMLDEVLCEATRAQRPHALVDFCSLGRLDLSDNGLLPDALKTLVVLLDRHEVQDIRLENALALADSTLTVEAITAVLRSLFAPTMNHQSPVSVSLANNSLDPRYYQAICEALETKTRPLRRLSLARTMSVFNTGVREGCWTWLAPIMLTTQVSEPGCELDLSGNPFYPQDSICFRQRVGVLHNEHCELVRCALEQHLPVLCRVSAATPSYLFPSDNDVAVYVLDSTAQYPVTAITPNGFVLVESGGTPSLEWVKYESITMLDITGSTIRRHQPRFHSLVLNEMRVNVPLHHFLAVVGSELRRLSVGHLDVNDFVGRMLVFSPHITHLSVEACRLTTLSGLTVSLQSGRAPALASLNLSSNGLGFQSVGQLVELYRAMPELQLRHLQLQKCHIGARGLAQLGEIMETSRWLEIVELDRSGRRDHEAEDSEYAVQRDVLASRYDNAVIRAEPLPLRAQLAFLSVGSKLEAVKSMDAPVASLVLEFAATTIVRHLLWG